MERSAGGDSSAGKLLKMLFMGYGTVMVMMGLALTITLFTGDHIAEIGNDIIRVRQPIAVLSQRLEADLNLSTSALNAYLLTGDPESHRHYEALRSRIHTKVKALQQRFGRQAVDVSGNWREIKGLITTYDTLGAAIIKLHGDEEQNYPGITLASRRLHPINMSYQTLLNGLIEEIQQDNNRKISARLYEIRRYWMLMTSEFRVFMSTRSANNRANMQLYLEQHDQALAMLAKNQQFPDEYGLELEELQSISETYQQRLPDVLELIAGEEWRKDAFVMRTELQPLVAKLQQRLSSLAEQQVEASEKSGTVLTDELESLQSYNLSILVFSLIFGALVAFIISRGIYRMVGQIEKSTKVADEMRKTAVDHAEELEKSLHQLETTQAQLVHSERLASLGGLVAGIAHEINTPLGISVTATSHIMGKAQKMRRDVDEGKLKKSALLTFLDEHDEAISILTPNLQRAADLVRSFKQVAVDQTSEQKREFEVCEFLRDVLRSLQPELKHRPVTAELECGGEYFINSYPGALSQLITNLLVNSLRHAFTGDTAGKITLTVNATADEILLLYGDDGCGIPSENLGKIFDPFFTTKRGQGGSGLGLHIIYNIITGKLGGSIECQSREGEGTMFTIRVPRLLDKGEE